LQGAAGGPNLYLASLSGSGAVELLRFVATPEDNAGFGGISGGHSSQPSREVDADPAGSIIAFRSTTPLVPGRSTGGKPQVFVFDASRGELSCASCPGDDSDPASEANLAPSGPGVVEETAPFSAEFGGISDWSEHARNVSTDGAVFFQTAVPLLPADRNQAVDIYEWRGGRLNLISAGAGERYSAFAGAGADGSDVFFSSATSLVAGAQAGIQHIYDARVGGGFAPPTGAPPCEGADCRGPSGNPPARQVSAGSSLFTGPGNFQAGKHHKKVHRRHHRRHHRRRRAAKRLDGRTCHPRHRCHHGKKSKSRGRMTRDGRAAR
jgi:hypothetical protein